MRLFPVYLGSLRDVALLPARSRQEAQAARRDVQAEGRVELRKAFPAVSLKLVLLSMRNRCLRLIPRSRTDVLASSVGSGT